MHTSSPVRLPRTWFHLGKYLIPVGLDSRGLNRVKPPRFQVPVARIAAEHSEQVSLQTLGRADVLREQSYECYQSGKRQSYRLPTKFVSPAFVAQIKNGMSFGRHCCVIGPAGKAIRETGFHLDGTVIAGESRVHALRPQYWRKRWEGDVTSRPWLPAKQHVSGRVAVVNKRFSHNYYHWLTEVLPRLATLHRAGITADYYLVECLTPFQRNVLAAWGIEPRQMIQPHCRLLLEADELIVPSLPTPSCLRHFRELLLDRLQIDNRSASSRKIFITRRKTGTRTLSNEAELEAFLSEHQFETHAMEDYSLAEQAQLIREAATVVAMHGAGLANLLFARPGTSVVEIVPAGRYNATCYPEKSRVYGLHHQQVFAERARHRGEFQVALTDVELALAQARRPMVRAAAA